MKRRKHENTIIKILFASSMSSVALYLISYAIFGDIRYWFLNWNLLLAWLPILFSWLLVKQLENGRWSSWQGITYTLLWLGFLPNSFYIVTDFIHLRHDTSLNALYYAVMIMSFSLSGFMLGYVSLYAVHTNLIKRLSPRASHTLVATILLLCSFAIYLGRYLRWNTWDVLVNPAGLLFDVTDRFINPETNKQTFYITAIFFILLSSLYYCIWKFIELLHSTHQDNLLN